MCLVFHFQPKMLFFFLLFKPLLQHILTQGMPYYLIKVSSFQMRHLLSNLNGGFRSYLRTTKGCQTRYFMLAPIYILVLRWIRGRQFIKVFSCQPVSDCPLVQYPSSLTLDPHSSLKVGGLKSTLSDKSCMNKKFLWI